MKNDSCVLINFEDKKFYSSKEAILLDSVDLSKIVVSSRCKYFADI